MSPNNKKQKHRISRKNIDNKNKQDIKNRKRNPIVRGLVIASIVILYILLLAGASIAISFFNNQREADTEESYIRETVDKNFPHFEVSKITYKDTSSTGLLNHRYSSHEYLVDLTNDMNYCGLDKLVFMYVAEEDGSYKEPGIMEGFNIYDLKDTSYSEEARNNLIKLMNTTYRDYCNGGSNVTHLKDVVNSVFMKDAINDMNQDLALNKSRKIENYYLLDATNISDKKRIVIIFYLENDEWVIVKSYL